MSQAKRNFYEILNAASNASAEELKSNYKQLILQCHPDKLQQQQQQQQQGQDASSSQHADKLENDLNNAEFVAITEAWNCLKDPTRRKQYDAELLLNKFHTHNNIYAHIKLSEMKKCLATDEDGEDDNVDYATADQLAQVNGGGRRPEDAVGGGAEGRESDSNKESSSSPSYIYTFDCRCGGQYMVDESAEQYCRKGGKTAATGAGAGGAQDDDDDDDAASAQNNNRNLGGMHNTAGVGGQGVDCHVDDNDDDSDNELIVECSECSLVIILNG